MIKKNYFAFEKIRMFTIELKKLQFFSFHGLYEKEKKKGNHFIVDVKINYLPKSKNKEFHIQDLIDYSDVHKIICTGMSVPTPLLESLSRNIATDIKKNFPAIKYILVKITKVKVPIKKFKGTVRVSFEKKWSN